MTITNISWLIMGLSIIGLAITTWRYQLPEILRGGLVIIAALSLGYALTGNIYTVGLLALNVILVGITWRLTRGERVKSWWGVAWIAVLVFTLILSRFPRITTIIGPAIWLGISYFIFRLIHVVLDARRNRLGDVSLAEMLVYALHPASLLSGPIDRVQHSVKEQCTKHEWQRYVIDGLWRLFIGIFKKVVLADTFYKLFSAYDVANASSEPVVIAWVWVLSFAFYIYFDFAAYSDIAIGIGCLMGLRLPDNFANPYMQPNIAAFWQTWHITLSNWLRDYIFFPLSRAMLKRFGSRFTPAIMFTSYMTTMVVCGLWHGLDLRHAAWGVWHGVGLFMHSQLLSLRRRFKLPVLPHALSVVLTFSFVALGWVFFNAGLLPTLRIFGFLVGINR